MSKEQEIKANNEVYHFIVSCAEYFFSAGKTDKALMFCQGAASYATFNYCGFYSESKLENLLLRIGQKFVTTNQFSTYQKPIKTSKKILHYATSIHAIGGHTRLIENWIKNDSENSHDVVLTSQQDAIPDFMLEAMLLVEGNILTTKNTSAIDKAAEVRALASNYDVVVLHHHANDIIPVLAFSSDTDVPICVLNHGDHRYWIGTAICDILIEIRENIIEPDKKRRRINNFALLPIPIKSKKIEYVEYLSSREKLGVKEDEVMLLSIGASYKYVPIDERDFFKDIAEVVKNKKVKLFVVGINPDEELVVKYKNSNVFFISPTFYLDDYKNACDVYVEGYPFSSFTAYLEVGAMGKPIHRMYNPPLLNEYNIFDYPNKISYPASEKNWIFELLELVDKREKRIDFGILESENLVIHGLNKWKEYLSTFYEKAYKVRHQIKYLQPVSHLLIESNDLYLLDMQSAYKVGTVLSDFYDLPFLLKIKMTSIKYIDRIISSKLSIRSFVSLLLKHE